MNAPIHGTSIRQSRAQQRTSLGALTISALILGAWIQGCSSGSPTPITTGQQSGSIVNQPDPSIGSKTFVVDNNLGGQRTSLHLSSVFWGRMVNVRDSSGVTQNSNMVVGEDIRTDGIDYQLEINPITEETTVTILHLAGSAAYVAAFQRLDANLVPVLDKSLSTDELPPFSLIPRNATIVLKFDDLLDNSTITRENLRVVTGYPAATPFDGLVLPDINHGDLYDANGDGVLEFHTTRVLIGTTVSSIQAGQSNPPLPINNLGLPASLNQSQANVAVRIPTLRDASVGQIDILNNLSGKPLSSSSNGSVDLGVSTHDIVRAVRSGGGSATTADPNNGFLVDEIAPKLVGVQPIQVSTPSGVAGDYVTTVDYVLDACAVKPKVGDVIEQPGVFAEVTQANSDPSGGSVANVHFRIVFPANGALTAGPAQISTVWDSVQNFGKEGCFVSYSSVAPGATTPGQGVSSDGTVLLRFSEPMDPSTLTAFDNFPVLRVNPATSTPTARDYVIGAVAVSPDLRTFTFSPVAKFKHTLGSSNDRYYVNVASGSTGPLDLAGNPLASALPAVNFTIDPADATENNGGLVFRFSSLDELNNDGRPEWRGQFLTDVVSGKIIPRPVTRLRATCDRTIPVPGIQPTFTTGVQTPLSALGSKLQSLWRYCDVGYALVDESTYNVDVEHLYWAPAGGNVVADAFDLFEIRLAHTRYLPDESVDPTSLLPIYPNSGLVTTYASNLLDATGDPQQVVHPRELGYIVNPGDKKFSATGQTQVMPYPLNQGITVPNYRYYTWRDTSILAKGAVADSPGAELRIVCSVVYGLGAGCFSCPYLNSNVPTIGLPLLMEFRCFPDSTALGLNALDINLALNSSAKPNFRAFSTGGTNTSGQSVQVNPDLATIATGGYNPTSVPPGQTTIGADNTVYLGEMDLVLRLSRIHSIWLDSQINAPTYLTPVVEPRDSDQPLGTRIDLAFRGATIVSPNNSNITLDATFVDAYGNAAFCPSGGGANQCAFTTCTTNGVPTFFQSNSTWRTSLTQINGAKLFQVRATFVSNTDTNLSPSLSALGFAFRQ